MHEQKQPPEVFYKKGVFRNFSKFTPVPGSQIPQMLEIILLKIVFLLNSEVKKLVKIIKCVSTTNIARLTRVNHANVIVVWCSQQFYIFWYSELIETRKCILAAFFVCLLVLCLYLFIFMLIFSFLTFSI